MVVDNRHQTTTQPRAAGLTLTCDMVRQALIPREWKRLKCRILYCNLWTNYMNPFGRHLLVLWRLKDDAVLKQVIPHFSFGFVALMNSKCSCMTGYPWNAQLCCGGDNKMKLAVYWTAGVVALAVDSPFWSQQLAGGDENGRRSMIFFGHGSNLKPNNNLSRSINEQESRARRSKATRPEKQNATGPEMDTTMASSDTT